MSVDRPVCELFARKRLLRSVEFFPPKDDAGVAALRQTALALGAISPDFVSVTYGAGGSTRERTAQISAMLRKDYGYAVMPHLTCVNHTRAEIAVIARSLHDSGIRSIMALRGDVPMGVAHETAFKDGLRHGSDIVRALKEELPDLCCGVGGYPEKHPEAGSIDSDIANLKRKIDAGAGFITTQLFFDNSVYHSFVGRCRAAGIGVPILPGIMPALSLKQLHRMTELSGARVPADLVRRLEVAGDHTDAVEFVGLEWAVTQIRDLIANGAPGYHLYVLNRAKPALALAAALS